ncbi:MAG: hypothetical protein J6B94_12855 [Lachnospiraceae bacterium]|nr:hypothetical protein [Lachnospiraceae bacterium]
MEDRCIFCGTTLGRLQKRKLHCGNTEQILCKNCYPKYEPLSAVERAEAALKSGRAADAAELRKYLENVWDARKKKEEEKEVNNKKRTTDIECLRCKGKMLEYGPVTFKLGEETYFFSDLNRLASGSLTMNIMRCEKCGKLEFYAPDSTELDKLMDE